MGNLKRVFFVCATLLLLAAPLVCACDRQEADGTLVETDVVAVETVEVMESAVVIPEGPMELTLIVTNLGNWEGPWEFLVSLE